MTIIHGGIDEDEENYHDRHHHHHELEDPDSSSSMMMVQPLVEMSQDCVVEWNEESQPSLRRCEYSTPMTRTTTSTTTNGSSTSPLSSNRNSMKRSRSSTSLTKEDDQSLSPIRRTLEPQNADVEETSSTRIRGSTDQELDTIFSLLEQQQDTISPNGPTQRIRNPPLVRTTWTTGTTNSNSPTATVTATTNARTGPLLSHLYHHRPVVSSLASRRQRQQQRRRSREGKIDQGKENANNGMTNPSNQKHREANSIESPSKKSSFQSSCPTIHPSHNEVNNETSDSGAFDSLLKELQQPTTSSEEENQNRESGQPPQPSIPRSPRLWTEEGTMETKIQRINQPPVRPSPSSTNGCSPSLPTKLPVTVRPPTPNPNEAKSNDNTTIHQSSSSSSSRQETVEDEFGDFDFDVDMSCVDQLLASRAMGMIPPLVDKSNDTGSGPRIAVVAQDQNPLPEDTTMVPPTASHVFRAPSKHASACLAHSIENNDDHDEFGDFPDVDLELLDQVAMRPPAREEKASTEELPRLPSQQQPLSALPAPTETVPIPPSTLEPANPSKLEPTIEEVPEMDDEFGDFPNVDFTMIDQAIATRTTNPIQSTSIAVTSQDPLSSDIVRNQRVSDVKNCGSGLSFIKFSRYKVLKIFFDQSRFFKTIVVAAWTERMIQDDYEETKIHQNDKVQERAARLSDVPIPPKNTQYTEAGQLQLRGQWYYTDLQEGDTIHICSLTGRYRTDPAALPIILHSHPPPGSDNDDLVIIHHPDLLMTPTVICETVSCPRRAVLKQRNGSTGLTAKSPLIGTLRHALFGICLKERTFDLHWVRHQIKRIVRENAESMIGCGVTTIEAEQQLLETVPVILDFVKEHTTLLSPNQVTMTPHAFVEGHIGRDRGVRFAAHATYSIEEPIVSPELALKGFVDAVMETTTTAAGSHIDRNQHTITGLKHSLMALELKTGHNQTSQHTHMGQLSLYTLMLQGRYGTKVGADAITSIYSSKATSKPDPEGAASSGLLLYLNQKSSKATHVAPEFDEFKSLIGQRNITASELLKSSKLRGIALAYQDEPLSDDSAKKGTVILQDPAPPVQLPVVQQSVHSCKICFENRTCMLYARSETDIDDGLGVKKTHGELLTKFTSRLQDNDLEYFRKWDRLIDLEAHATTGNTASAWLVDAHAREMTTGETISSLVYKGTSDSPEESGVLLHFIRDPTSSIQSQLDKLAIPIGSHVVISTDGSMFDDSQSEPKMEYLNTQRERKKFRHRMNVVRGFLKLASTTEVIISASQDDKQRIQDLQDRFSNLSMDDKGDIDFPLLFRVDRENAAVGIGTLRQNIINLFTADSPKSAEESSPLDVTTRRRLPRLRNFVVRLETPSFLTIDDGVLFQSLGSPIQGCDLQVLEQEFKLLNQDQQDAVRKVIAMNDYTIIQGLPGTGKTSTLSFIARLLVARGKRVLITSYTNNAVDNVVIKLAESGVCEDDESLGFPRVVRIGPRYSCHELARLVHVHDIASSREHSRASGVKSSIATQTSSNLPCAESLSRVISNARIVCSTVLTVPRSPLLAKESFDVVIVDEAGQTSQPAILGALMAANTFVLVGDHKQLPPLVSSEIAQVGGYGESMLMRLAKAHPSSIAALTFQYRMNEEICQLSSLLTYDGILKCGNDAVAGRTLDLPGFPKALPPIAAMKKGLWPWLRMTVSPSKPVLFVDTDSMRKSPMASTAENGQFEGLEEKQGGRAGGKVTNPTEASIVLYIIHGLVAAGLSPKDIGVISPFRAQVHLLAENRTMADWVKAGLEISTIDRYQGRDKPAILLSFVRSNCEGSAGRLLQDERRLNVALTRAKAKLILVGSFSTLKTGSAPLAPLLSLADAKQQRQLLPENALQCYKFG